MAAPEQERDGKKTPGEHGQLIVTIHDEDAGGEPIRLSAGPGWKVGKVIDDLYARLKRTPSPSDRLLCLANGEAVGPHREEHLRNYAKTACAALEWTFAGDTGGA